MVKGYVNSIQTLGTLDGPGVRFVIFMQGCNLRCGCCHNPDTWEMTGGTEYSVETLMKKIGHYREYFGKEGGITLSGGEPLLQAEFAKELFSECKKSGINTCLDTSGSIINNKVKELLEVTDRVLLDIKYTNDEQYKRYVGCSINAPLEFLKYVDDKKIPVTLRQVIIPTLNDNDENINKLKEIKEKHLSIDKVELLAFKKICKVKYDKMGIDFPFDSYPTPDSDKMKKLQNEFFE